MGRGTHIPRAGVRADAMTDEHHGQPTPGGPVPGRSADLWRTVVDSSRDLVVLIDSDGSLVYISPAVHDLMGYGPDELLTGNPLDLIHPDDQPEMFGRLQAMDTPEQIRGPALVRVHHRDGSWRWLEVLASSHLDDPTVQAILVNARDVTERVRTERALAAEKERYQVLVESIPDLVARFDTEGRTVFLNPAAERLLHMFTGDDPEGQHAEWPDESAESAMATIREVIRTGESRTYESELIVDGEAMWLEVCAVPEAGPDGRIEAVTTISHDITQRKATEHDLTRRAFEDPLTGLVNRAGFEMGIDEVLRSQRNGLIALLYLDVDHFKAINDSQGHAAGDEHLRQVAERLRAAVRPNDLVARLGGDEFAIQPEALTEAEDALALADRVHRALEDLSAEHDGRRVGTASIGVAVVDPRREQPSMGELVRRADAAMYEAKRLGRGRTVRHPPDARS